ncbi:unnamed protein product [Adineta ricciae]|uniref:Uncharacterized protein n=1 Tax=Adineta ricciae TaxID=249248 RepID=A0A815T7D3_ADIRI|nr:unnamed protein product [Adineta ricciae]
MDTNKRIDKKKRIRLYFQTNRILKWFEDNSKSSISGRGNQAYVLATTPIYDEWVRNNYELQRTKRRDDLTNSRFVQKKINYLTTMIAQANAAVTDLQIQLGTYWTQTVAQSTAQTNAQTTAELTTQLMLERMGQTATQTTDQTVQNPNSTTATNRDRLEKSILRYIQHCTQHVKRIAENRIQLAKAQMEEFKAL